MLTTQVIQGGGGGRFEFSKFDGNGGGWGGEVVNIFCWKRGRGLAKMGGRVV